MARARVVAASPPAHLLPAANPHAPCPSPGHPREPSPLQRCRIRVLQTLPRPMIFHRPCQLAGLIRLVSIALTIAEQITRTKRTQQAAILVLNPFTQLQNQTHSVAQRVCAIVVMQTPRMHNNASESSTSLTVQSQPPRNPSRKSQKWHNGTERPACLARCGNRTTSHGSAMSAAHCVWRRSSLAEFFCETAFPNPWNPLLPPPSIPQLQRYPVTVSVRTLVIPLRPRACKQTDHRLRMPAGATSALAPQTPRATTSRAQFTPKTRQEGRTWCCELESSWPWK